MNNYQITYEDALRICEAHKNFNFYKTEVSIDGFKVVTFNYFLCEYKNFVAPLPDEPGIHGYDMRGVTFVFNEDGTLYKRFLMLKKFFNINQVEETQYTVVKDKEIYNITEKEDGSLIAFMNLPNGKVFAKTQAGFTNEQSIEAMNLYHNQTGIKEFVDETLENDCTPLFEYVAYDNRIVLKYSGRQLRLIGIRNNKTGKFTSAVHLNVSIDIPIVKIIAFYFLSIADLLEQAKSTENIEGWVIEFEDGQMIKIKTEWYCNLHGIRTVSIFREDFIIQNYLKESLDDAISGLDPADDNDAFAFIERVKNATINWSNEIDNNVDVLVKEYYTTYFANWTKFATDKHKAPYFGLARTKIETPDDYKYKKINFMLNAARHLMEAKKLVEKYENSDIK